MRWVAVTRAGEYGFPGKLYPCVNSRGGNSLRCITRDDSIADHGADIFCGSRNIGATENSLFLSLPQTLRE